MKLQVHGQAESFLSRKVMFLTYDQILTGTRWTVEEHATRRRYTELLEQLGVQ